jgi:3-oxoacyl-(acyl-carrier-protein) synthase
MGYGVHQMIYLTNYRTAASTHVDLLDDIDYPQKVHWFPDTYKRVSSGLFYAPHKLAEKVLDSELVKHLRENKVGKTAFIFASGNSHLAGIGPRIKKPTQLTYEYKFLPFTLTQVYAGRMAQALGATDHIVTDSTACASSLKAMMDVQTLIKMYGFDRVIVLSFEDAVSNSVLEFFGEAQASLTKKDEEAGVLPSAFDEVNHGFRVGQGAVLAVFDSPKVVFAGKSTPLASLRGAYTASEECSNAIGQLEDGQGFIRAIEGALEVAKESAYRVSVVKTHGTGTLSNNKSEKAALLTTLKDFVATSYKAKIGHTMGASGLLETCLLIDDLKRGVVPKIENRTTHDTQFLSHDVSDPGGLILSLAAGMGNVYSAALLSLEI